MGSRKSAIFGNTFYIFYFLALVSCSSKQKDKKEDERFAAYEKRELIASNNVWMPYRILFPENYDSSQQYPLILFLHGAGERGGDNESQLVHGASLFLDQENRKKFPAIVIYPQCPNEGYWASVKVDRTKKPYTLDFDYTRETTKWLAAALEITDKVIREENVDTTRLYMIGLSMGGMGTFETIHDYPNKFAAAIPICGGGDTLRYTDEVKGFPFWVFHGAADIIVHVDNSRAMVERLKKIGAAVTYTEYPEVNHNSWDNAFREQELLPWLFSQKRK